MLGSPLLLGDSEVDIGTFGNIATEVYGAIGKEVRATR